MLFEVIVIYIRKYVGVNWILGFWIYEGIFGGKFKLRCLGYKGYKWNYGNDFFILGKMNSLVRILVLDWVSIISEVVGGISRCWKMGMGRIKIDYYIVFDFNVKRCGSL